MDATAFSRILQQADPRRGDGHPGRCLVVARRLPVAADQLPVPIDHLDGVGTVADLGDAGNYSLGIVFDQLEYMTPSDATHLLARLRDRHTRKLLVCDGARTLARSDFFALGFEIAADIEFARCFRYDADAPSRQREWNSPSNWANPENFDRFRW